MHIPTVPPLPLQLPRHFPLHPPVAFGRLGAMGRPATVQPASVQPRGGGGSGRWRLSLAAAFAALLRPFAARSVSG
jgi:hypothetical protein